MFDSTLNQALAVVRKRGILRPRELDRYGLPRQYLHRLYQRGELVRRTDLLSARTITIGLLIRHAVCPRCPLA